LCSFLQLTGNDVYTAIIAAMLGDAEDGYITLGMYLLGTL